MGSDLGASVAGTVLLADPALAAVMELLFFLPFGAPLEVAWAYDGRDMGQSGAKCLSMKVVGSGTSTL